MGLRTTYHNIVKDLPMTAKIINWTCFRGLRATHYHQHVKFPCRLCLHVFALVGLVCINDPWSYALEPLMPDRSKVRCQSKWDTEVYAARGEWRFASGTRQLIRRVCTSDVSVHQTCLCNGTSDSVTPEEDLSLLSLKKAKLEPATREGADIGPTVCQGRGNCSNEKPWTWHQRQLQEWAEFLVDRSLTLSPAYVFRRGRDSSY